jgi:hypothetical protein
MNTILANSRQPERGYYTVAFAAVLFIAFPVCMILYTSFMSWVACTSFF